MAITVVEAAWEHSTAKGNRLLALLALAKFASEEQVQRGYPALAFPSQATLARMCRCERSTIQLALEGLQQSGEIRDTGERHWGKYRGTVEWEVLPNIDFETGENLTEDQAPDFRSDKRDLTDLPLPRDRSADDLTDLPLPPDRQVGHKPVVEPVVEQEVRTGSAASLADARETIFDTERIELLRELHEATPWDDLTEVYRRLNQLDGEEITMDMWARRLIRPLYEEGQFGVAA